MVAGQGARAAGYGFTAVLPGALLAPYGHLWPDRDKSTRATIEAVFAARAELSRNADDAR